MIRPALLFAATVWVALPLAAQTPAPAAAPHHEANFDAERKQADEFFLAQKPLEALPLYEDLSRQDPTIAVFAERYGAGLLARQATLTNPADKAKAFQQAIAEIQRAQSLGDNSAYVRNILSFSSRSFVGAVLSGFPLTVGWTHTGTPEAQAVFQQAEAAFGKSDWATAAKLYSQAATLDSAWYDPALYAGDSYFRLKDTANAGIWFARAIAVDPDRETAYRYWGDALFQSGDPAGAREKFVQALIAEPYSTPAQTGLVQWAQHTGHQIGIPAIKRPDFTTPNGVLKIDPELAASTADGRASWIVYQQYRVAHGARVLNQIIVPGGSDANGVVTPTDYRHTIAEEHAALRAMLADIDSKLKSGALVEANSTCRSAISVLSKKPTRWARGSPSTLPTPASAPTIPSIAPTTANT